MVLHAVVLFLSAKFLGAISQLNAVLKLDPDNRRASTLRSRIKDIERLKEEGNLSFKVGLWDEAIMHWNHALQVRFVLYHSIQTAEMT